MIVKAIRFAALEITTFMTIPTTSTDMEPMCVIIAIVRNVLISILKTTTLTPPLSYQ